MIQRIRGITLLTAFVALAALGVAALGWDAASTKPYGALATAAEAKDTTGAKVLLNTGISGTGTTLGGLVVVAPYTSTGDAVYGSATSIAFPTASTCVIAYEGKTYDGARSVTGTQTITVTDPATHKGKVSITEFIALPGGGTKLLSLVDQPCNANVVPK